MSRLCEPIFSCMDQTRPPIRLLLVDDSELVRRGIKSVLSLQDAPRLEVVGEAGSVASAIAEALRLEPEIVLLDIRLPDGSGFGACREILKALPKTRVIVLTSYSNDHLVYEAVTAGAHGYLMKEIDPSGLLRAVVEVAKGGTTFDPEATTRVVGRLRGRPGEGGADLAVLSGQERRVLALVAAGLTNKQVGEQLGLSENTVKNYLVNVFEKLQVKRRAQAAAIYVQQANPGCE